MFLSLNNHVVMLSIACPLRYSLKTIKFILDSSLMPFASLLSYVMQLLHFMVLTYHLLHPSFALLLCFRRLPSEPQVRACNPELLQATVLASRHGLARVWIIPSANHRSHLLHGPYLLILPLVTLWRVACASFLDCSFIASFTMSWREAIFLGKSFCSTGVASFTLHTSLRLP